MAAYIRRPITGSFVTTTQRRSIGEATGWRKGEIDEESEKSEKKQVVEPKVTGKNYIAPKSCVTLARGHSISSICFTRASPVQRGTRASLIANTHPLCSLSLLLFSFRRARARRALPFSRGESTRKIKEKSIRARVLLLLFDILSSSSKRSFARAPMQITLKKRAR